MPQEIFSAQEATEANEVDDGHKEIAVPSRSEMLVAPRVLQLGLVCRGYDDCHTLKKIDKAMSKVKQSKNTEYCYIS